MDFLTDVLIILMFLMGIAGMIIILVVNDNIYQIVRWIEHQDYVKSGNETEINGVKFEEYIRLNDRVRSWWPKRGEKLNDRGQ